ncbi:MAG: M20 family metallopeptidase, partial [Armatimonadota bacterium]
MWDSISHPVYDAALNIKDDLVRWRRHIHRNPEPSMQEHETAAYVAEHLTEFGLSEVHTGVGETGVVGLIEGEGDTTVALRADMDALELVEENDVPYASRKPGVMHACGHDGHTTCLLGAAAILCNQSSLRGNVKLIFQPGEEGYAGARKMIRDGCLEDPDVGAIAGLHLTNEVPSGYVGIRHGYWTAQSDNIDMTVHGQTAHASRPDQ